MQRHLSDDSPLQDDFVRKLEGIHRNVVDAGSSSQDHEVGSEPELADAAALFRLIEAVKHEKDDRPEELDFQEEVDQTIRWASDDTEILPPHRGGTSAADATTDWSGGKRLGRFTILRKLGEGGYGFVFLADDEALDRRVALKIPRPEAILTNDMRQRFLREGKAAALLGHPHIVPVLEAGNEGPICFIVNGFVDGISLAEWLAQAPDHKIDPRQAARLTAVLADAVQHAHGKGVIHRDLKPANILLEGFTADGDSQPAATSIPRNGPAESAVQSPDGCLPPPPLAQAARITDFGLAKMQQDQGLTGTGALIGTPAYMSPEQARGMPTTEAVDTYALGAILYEMLTGRPPHGGRSVVETLRNIDTHEPLPPRRLSAEVPKDLNAICLKCLEKNPARRYASARELQLDVQRHLAGEPVQARAATLPERCGKWCWRNPKLAMALTAFVLAVVVGGTFFAMQYRRTVNSNRMLQRAMTFLDTKAVSDTSNDAKEVEIAASLENALQDVRAYRSVDKNSRGRLAYSVGMRYIHLARFEEAQEALQLAETLYAAIYPPEHESRLATQSQLGLAYFKVGQYARALEILAPAAALAQEHLGLSTSVTKNILNHLAITYGALGQHERQLEILETLHGAPRDTNQPEEDHQLLHNYAQVLAQMGRMEEAIQLYLEARTIFGEKDPRTLEIDKSLSVVYLNAGRIEEALRVIQRDLPICRELMGNDHRQTLMWENSLAGALLKSGRVEESVAVLREVLPRVERAFGAQHPAALLVAINLGGGYLRLGESTQAVAQFASAHERASRRLGRDHPLAIKAYQLRGQGLTEAGRYAEAEEVFNDLLEAEWNKPAPDLPQMAKHYWRLGINATLAEEPHEAESHLEKSLELLAEHEPDCWQIADVQSRLGALYCGRGDRGRGWPLVREGRDLLKARGHLISVPIRASTIAAAEARVAACAAEES